MVSPAEALAVSEGIVRGNCFLARPLFLLITSDTPYVHSSLTHLKEQPNLTLTQLCM